MSRPSEYQLEVETLTPGFIKRYGSRECDGCGREIKPGEKWVRGIQSCCGSGCFRELCITCIKRIHGELLGVTDAQTGVKSIPASTGGVH